MDGQNLTNASHPQSCRTLIVVIYLIALVFGYRYTCRGLFERHKLLFSFQMCAKILEAAGKLNMDEYNFFLKGGVVSFTHLVQYILIHLNNNNISHDSDSIKQASL